MGDPQRGPETSRVRHHGGFTVDGRRKGAAAKVTVDNQAWLRHGSATWRRTLLMRKTWLPRIPRSQGTRRGLGGVERGLAAPLWGAHQKQRDLSASASLVSTH